MPFSAAPQEKVLCAESRSTRIFSPLASPKNLRTSGRSGNGRLKPNFNDRRMVDDTIPLDRTAQLKYLTHSRQTKQQVTARRRSSSHREVKCLSDLVIGRSSMGCGAWQFFQCCSDIARRWEREPT